MTRRRVKLPPPPTPDDFVRERCRRTGGLRYFIKHFWPLIEPSPFIDTWVVGLLAEYYEAVSAGEIDRLLINGPPRTVKSVLGAMSWPAWDWTQRPQHRWLTSSYSASLATDHSAVTRRIIESEEYQRLWPHVRLLPDQNAKGKYDNSAGGGRRVTSIASGATGFGGNIVFCDDPHNVKTTTPDERAGVCGWWAQSMSTRLNPGGDIEALVVQAQRVAEGDLSDLCIELGYTHVCLPMEYERDHKYFFCDDPREEEGELLCPELHGRAKVERLKATLGPRGAAGQLQQRPSVAEGAILKRDLWRRYDRGTWWPEGVAHEMMCTGCRRPVWIADFWRVWHQCPGCGEVVEHAVEGRQIIDTWDLAVKKKKTSAYSVGFAQGLWRGDVFGLARERVKERIVGQMAAVKTLKAREPGARKVLVEDAAQADAVDELLKGEVPGIVLVRPSGSKVTRAEAWSVYLEAGRLYLPEGAQWADELIEECASVPDGTYWDQVDAWGQGVLHLLDRKGMDEVEDIDLGDLPHSSPWRN